MQIESHLPNFENEQALLIVAGEKMAKLFCAHAGSIDEIEHFRPRKLKYSDHESFFTKGSKSSSFASGAVFENPKQHLLTQFLHGLRDEVKKLRATRYFNAIYLFAPIHTTKSLKAVFDVELENLIRMTIYGNLTKKHPFELLQLIREETEALKARRHFYSSEVRRLLSSTEGV